MYFVNFCFARELEINAVFISSNEYYLFSCWCLFTINQLIESFSLHFGAYSIDCVPRNWYNREQLNTALLQRNIFLLCKKQKKRRKKMILKIFLQALVISAFFLGIFIIPRTTRNETARAVLSGILGIAVGLSLIVILLLG
jgi:hypothetical protein